MNIHNYLNKYSDLQLSLMQEKFALAYPFPHLCIDNFLENNFAERLLKDFPSEADDNYKKFCVEDGGKVGTNYANSQVETFPDLFKQLDQIMRSREFLEFLSSITGINNFEYDADYFGGGIRESRNTTFLPCHLDFNYHPRTLSHRRLNLLLYLNKDWLPEYGGAIQMHLNPNKFKERSLISEFLPIFNRCVIFETSEVSWHGFSKLNLPLSHLGRKAWSIYFYTKDRPNAADIKMRNTEYVEPPLPSYIKEGYMLTENDVALLKEFLIRRDSRIEMLYELRATMDDKYSHLWNEYEYYLNKAKQFEALYNDIIMNK